MRRKITVEDVSKKRLMDLRLLYGVAYGNSWFGRWGYRFCRGSFRMAEHNYDRAIEVLNSLELGKIIQDLSNTDKHGEIRKLIRQYRYLSETQLATMKDLLRFMLTVKSRAPLHMIKATVAAASSTSKSSIRDKTLVKEKSLKDRSFTSAIANIDSRWPEED